MLKLEVIVRQCYQWYPHILPPTPHNMSEKLIKGRKTLTKQRHGMLDIHMYRNICVEGKVTGLMALLN